MRTTHRAFSRGHCHHSIRQGGTTYRPMSGLITRSRSHGCRPLPSLADLWDIARSSSLSAQVRVMGLEKKQDAMTSVAAWLLSVQAWVLFFPRTLAVLLSCDEM
jgi:hypothetical protein